MEVSVSHPAQDFVQDVGVRIAAADPLHEVLHQIIGFVSDFVHCDSCFVYVLEGKQLVLRASKNPHPEIVDRLRITVGDGITGWVAEHREIVAIESDACRDHRFRFFDELPEDCYQSFLSIPVLSRGRVVSVINVQHRDPYVFSARQIKAITAIGHLVGAAIEMARLQNEVAELSEKLAARKTVERAKGILQSDLQVSEEEAYGIITKQARSRRKTMKQIAEAILLTEELKRDTRPAAQQGAA
jgi:uroporphyrinogen-III synthase